MERSNLLLEIQQQNQTDCFVIHPEILPDFLAMTLNKGGYHEKEKSITSLSRWNVFTNHISFSGPDQ